ncbi:hypothetical protein TEU_09575 [Thermococcus eurythermalis]|uniref:IFT52 GIFT domain-containing protein n=1 Tax=Thermococcus eurythermalis TaxID=1505907 RepID=A0A097QVQ7_9EURY|nr:hypothetical protein [Thermococcus eurythermalis]AIU70560.1 hypothetical protein TEU_09575 [Thermococcus eurythermalis]
MRRWGLALIVLLVLGTLPTAMLPLASAAVQYVSIHDIQYTEDPSGDSPYNGQLVMTSGVVTAVTSKGFFIQNGTGPWSGIYVYLGTSPSVNQGDLILVTGTVEEHYGLTQIKAAPEDVDVTGTADIPEPVVLQTGDVSQEQWESVLVKVENVVVTNPDLGHGEWEIDDGSGSARVDDLMYRYTPEADQELSYVIGVVYYSYGNFKIEPRSAEDIGLPPATPQYQTIKEIRENWEDGKLVLTSGVVIGTRSTGFFIQNGTEPNSGIYVYVGGSPGVKLGDVVQVIGTTGVYKGLYQITDPTYEVVGTSELPEPVLITAGEMSDAYQSMLVRLKNVKVTKVDGKAITVEDSTGALVLYDYYEIMDVEVGDTLEYVEGIGYKYNIIEVYPTNYTKVPKAAPNPNALAFGLTIYYGRQYESKLSDLDELYEEFASVVSELTSYGVTFDEKLEAKINWVKSSMAAVNEEYELYKEFAASAQKNGLYLPAMIHIRRALFLGEDVKEEIEFLLPYLKGALEKVKSSSNQTGTQTNITLTMARVLIDASHGQHYVEDVGVEGLSKKIKSELGWEVTINRDPLTPDLLEGYDVVIILNPVRDLSSEEVSALQKYIENGGGLFIAGDWYRYSRLESLNAVVSKYGITFNADELMDDEKNSGKPYYPFVGIYNKAHPAMKFVPDDWTIYYNGGTLTISGNAVWLIKGYDTSYSVDADGNVVMAKGTNPILAAAVEAGKGRIIAYGSSKALSDDYRQKYIKSNWPFIKGALLWLAHQE